MFDELSDKVSGVFAKLRGRGVLNDADIKEGLREMRRVLLEADVSFQLTREFLENVEKKAAGIAAIKTVARPSSSSRSCTTSSPPCWGSDARGSASAASRPRS